MKKQFLFLSTAALLAVSLVSCVDNDEPKGLRQLRQAKANQWNAAAETTRAKIGMAVAADSLANELKILTNKAQEITNRSNELVNLKNEALNNIEIEGKAYKLNLTKAEYDYQIAEQKYNLAVLTEKNKTDLEKEKQNLLVAQLNVANAQKNLDDWNAKAALRKAQLDQEIKDAEADIKQAEADLKDRLLAIQDQLDRNVLLQESYAANLQADTYTTNLESLLIMATARKNAWTNNEGNVMNAYNDLKTKEGLMIDAQKALSQAQQALLIALNGYEKDSASYLKNLNDAVTTAQYNYDKQQKSVLLAEDALDEFNEVSKGDVETWNKAYNDLETEIATLKKEVKYKEIAILEADKAIDQAQANFDAKKKEVEKPLKDFNDKGNFYTFEVDAAIEEDFNLPGGANQFSYKNGIIANEDAIKNSDLSAQLDAILSYIGDDENPGMYKDEAGIKTLNDNIKGFNDEIKGFNDEIKGFNDDIDNINKQYTEDSSAYIAQINDKQAEIVTKQQQLAEYQNQNEVKAQFDADSVAFLAASEAYMAKALEYKWADNTNKSTKYEAVENAIKEFVDLYNDVDAGDILTDATLLAKRKSVQSQIKSYWTLRESFDGQKISDPVKDDVVDNALSDDAEKTTFDTYLTGSVTTLIGSNTRVDGGKNDGAWGKFIDIADKFIGGHTQYVMYKRDQMESFHANNELGSKGTMGAYYAWKYTIADLKKEIADLNKDIADLEDDILADRETADENIENKKQDIKDKEQEIADKEQEIADTEEEIANNSKWAALYDAINEVKEAYDDDVKALTIAQQEAYSTKLTPLEDALAKAEDNKAKLGDEKDELELEQGIKEAIQGKYLSLITAVNETSSADDAQLKAEIIIKFAVIELEHNIETAKQGVESKKLALDNAKKDLADFLAGEFDANQNNYISTVLTQDKNVKAKQVDYDKAVKDYEVAKAYFEEVLAAVEGEEE